MSAQTGMPYLFSFRPRPGDVWEIKRRGRKVIKEVGEIRLERFTRGKYPDKIEVRLLAVHWKRLPKGRYTFMRVKWVMKNGRRIATAKERREAQEARFKRLGV